MRPNPGEGLLSQNMLERYEGCLLGGAVGDALGYPVEFLESWEIEALYGPAGISGPVGTLLYSDDTQMTLSTAEGLLTACRAGTDPLTAIWSEFQRWYRGQSDPVNRRAPGNTCLTSLAGGVPGSLAHPLNDSRGCGGVMRAAPCALLPLPGHDPANLAAAQAALTHGSPEAYLPAWLLVRILTRLLYGEDLQVSAERSMDELHVAWGRAADETLAYARRGLDREEPDLIGEGWTGDEALGMALSAALRHEGDWPSGVLEAANVSGDSDSVATLTGSLLGTYLGVEAIPADWSENVEGSERLRSLACEMLDARES